VGANRTEGSQWRWPLIVGLLLGAIVIAISIYLSYRFAERIADALGDAAMNVVIRLSSFILVCIGVQILLERAEHAAALRCGPMMLN